MKLHNFSFTRTHGFFSVKICEQIKNNANHQGMIKEYRQNLNNKKIFFFVIYASLS